MSPELAQFNVDDAPVPKPALTRARTDEVRRDFTRMSPTTEDNDTFDTSELLPKTRLSRSRTEDARRDFRRMRRNDIRSRSRSDATNYESTDLSQYTSFAGGLPLQNAPPARRETPLERTMRTRQILIDMVAESSNNIGTSFDDNVHVGDSLVLTTDNPIQSGLEHTPQLSPVVRSRQLSPARSPPPQQPPAVPAATVSPRLSAGEQRVRRSPRRSPRRLSPHRSPVRDPTTSLSGPPRTYSAPISPHRQLQRDHVTPHPRSPHRVTVPRARTDHRGMVDPVSPAAVTRPTVSDHISPAEVTRPHISPARVTRSLPPTTTAQDFARPLPPAPPLMFTVSEQLPPRDDRPALRDEDRMSSKEFLRWLNSQRSLGGSSTRNATVGGGGEQQAGGAADADRPFLQDRMSSKEFIRWLSTQSIMAD